MLNRLGLLLFVMCPLLWVSAAWAQNDERTLYISVGEQKVVNVSGVKKISIGDPAIADVKVLGDNKIIVTGVGQGRTSLILFKDKGQENYAVVVGKGGSSANLRDLKRELGNRQGIDVRMVGDEIVIEGVAYSTEDFDRVNELSKMYGNVKNLVRLDASAAKSVADTISATLINNGLKDARAVVIGNTIFLEGSVSTKEELRKADLLLSALGRDVVNLLTVGVNFLIYIEVQFVEIKKNSNDKIGAKLPLDISGTVNPTLAYEKILLGPGNDSSLFRIEGLGNANFNFGMQFNDGYARVLAQPKLVCASGDKASFLAGGEIPIPLITQNQIAVEWKEFGVRLSMEPVADKAGNIRTKILSEVSDVDQSLSVQGIPGFRVRRISTSVAVRSGETVALSGLFEWSEGKDVTKFPGLGHIPILGEFFRQRTFTDRKTDLLVFVTPRVVSAASPQIQNLVKEGQDRYKEAESELLYGILD
ncbi:MAG: hypothetical protein GMKNLPBB_01192 [Myxococcota bacterium]|nr:hypothetical protein [Myxococcota bacterium]